MPAPPRNKVSISLIIRNDVINNTKPRIANLRVDWAFLSFPGSPKEVRYWNAPTTIIMKRRKMINVEAMYTRLPKTISRHSKVGTPPTTHEPHSFIPWAAYTCEASPNIDYKSAGSSSGHDTPKQSLVWNTTCSSVQIIARTITIIRTPTIAA